jgi:NIMA (never in mitosis gene a)-related kinase
MSLNDFEFREKLGTGSFGSVYIVKRKENQKIYAMKRVKLINLGEKEKQNSFNEVRLLASFSHPNIIGYKEAFFDEKSSTLNIVMEYADDGDLSSKIKDNIKKHLQFDENTIWSILIQILEGLNYLHKSRIIHRDLKSANIFLTKKGIVKIGDLNVSIIAKKKFGRNADGNTLLCRS